MAMHTVGGKKELRLFFIVTAGEFLQAEAKKNTSGKDMINAYLEHTFNAIVNGINEYEIKTLSKQKKLNVTNESIAFLIR